ncbi:MAG: (2Fe-2S)-binding protein [Candidatus Aureabacteria bacterium]|nr:(2Fe-2S)-binding protein [Candidatus Auribacterota bacterium]
MKYALNINGRPHPVEAAPGEILLDVLRREGYKGAKFGCGQGFCGACTVLIDGQPVNSCLQLVGLVEGRTITTIEGVGSVSKLHPIQDAYLDAGAVQCGYCTPGMVLATKALLDRSPDPTEEEIKRCLDGNYCRCTGYVKIIDAVKLAAKRRNGTR